MIDLVSDIGLRLLWTQLYMYTLIFVIYVCLLQSFSLLKSRLSTIDCKLVFIFECNAHISKSNQQLMHIEASPLSTFVSFSVIHYTRTYVTIRKKICDSTIFIETYSWTLWMMFPQHFYRLLEFYYCDRTKRHSESEFCEFERKSMCHMGGIT